MRSRESAVLEKIQAVISNDLSGRVRSGALFAGIIGDRPSQYAKSPSIWNPAFEALDLEAVYLPFDVEPERLEALVYALRQCEAYMGGNVTVPYKVSIIPYLDELDEKAEQIGAVNTIVRTPAGKLVGHNTDGQGGITSLTRLLPGHTRPFLSSLDRLRLLLIGAGGASRALAFYLAAAIGPKGMLQIANRNNDRTRELADAVNSAYGNCRSLQVMELKHAIADVNLVINATTCGQAGVRRQSDGSVTCLEPFSPLASALPAALPSEATREENAFYAQWMRASRAEVDRNNSESSALLTTVPVRVAFFDVVYAPLETVLLRQARLTGHRTLNGKGMNIAQAVDAFFNCVFKESLQRDKRWHEGTYQQVLETMYAVW